MIAKHFGTSFDLRQSEDDINAFFYKHQECGDCSEWGSRGSQIQLVYEQTGPETRCNALPEPGPVFETLKTFDPKVWSHE